MRSTGSSSTRAHREILPAHPARVTCPDARPGSRSITRSPRRSRTSFEVADCPHEPYGLLRMPIGSLPVSLQAACRHRSSSGGPYSIPLGAGVTRSASTAGSSRPSGRAPASATMRPLSRSARGRTGRRSLHDRNRAFAGRDEASRGVVCPGRRREPLLGWCRLFRYEVRCWPAGRFRISARRWAAPPADPTPGRRADARSRRGGPQARVGTRRAEGGRDVELELRDRVADRHRGLRPNSCAATRGRAPGWDAGLEWLGAAVAPSADTPRMADDDTH